MSWIHRLYETYEQCKGREPAGAGPLLPISHTLQQAHIEIVLDEQGNFKDARTIEKTETVIPATEQSAGRTGTQPPPHPLCDKIQYCAADYKEHGGAKPGFFKEYEELLGAWCQSPFTHPKARAILAYVRKHRVVADLVNQKILHLDADGKLLTVWRSEEQAPTLFRLLTAKAGERDQGDAFLRWHVREANNPCTATWEDASLHEAWARFDASTKESRGVCMVTGEAQAALALSHPKRIRHPADGAKLISANDASGYTFRGRFTDETGQQACGVSYEVSQKAHNALRWLIGRQAYRNDQQVVIAWAIAGKSVPDMFHDTRSLFLDDDEIEESVVLADETQNGDVGQAFAKRLSKAIAGYRATLDPTEHIIVMGLDSATPGRMAITFYRELQGSEFLDRLETWHEMHAWLQNFGRDARFLGAPSPRDIAETAYGRRLDDKLRRATVERLLPCIVDGRPLPRDLVESAARRTCNRAAFKKDEMGKQWEWEKSLGVACSMFRGLFKHRGYQMTLEADRTSRDYLYGRLLAVAEHIEGRALYVGGESRDTTAAKLMQRFAERPASTWRLIEPALRPYMARLRAKRPGFLREMEKLLDGIVSMFQPNDFLDDRKLTGEFLLGYHCQRKLLNPPRADNAAADDDEECSTAN